VVCMVPPGEFTKRGSSMASMGTLCILTKNVRNKGMWSSWIKKNGCRSRMNIEHTKHYFRLHLCCFSRHMIHLSSIGWPLSLRCLLILLLGTMISIVSWFFTAITQIRSTRCTGLYWSRVGITLAWSLLTTLLLEWSILLILGSLLKLIVLPILRPLLIWIAVPLTDWSLEFWMKPMLRICTLAIIIPNTLSFHLPFSIHLSTFIIQHNSLIHKLLETGIIITL
jgi:hypothetical protein